jgi:hypothetical protein
VSDESVRDLIKLRRLRVLDLKDSHVATAGFAAIRQGLLMPDLDRTLRSNQCVSFAQISAKRHTS